MLLLGACAYALRSLSQQILAKTYTPAYADFACIIIAVIVVWLSVFLITLRRGFRCRPSQSHFSQDTRWKFSSPFSTRFWRP
jgi:hypothetical protein